MPLNYLPEDLMKDEAIHLLNRRYRSLMIQVQEYISEIHLAPPSISTTRKNELIESIMKLLLKADDAKRAINLLEDLPDLENPWKE